MKRRTFIKTMTMAVGATGLVVAAVPALPALDMRPENMHRDFRPCCFCGVKRFEYHKPDCPRAAVPAGEKQFYESIRERLIEIMTRTGHSVERLVIQPEHAGFRFVRAWVEGESMPYTWNHPVVN